MAAAREGATGIVVHLRLVDHAQDKELELVEGLLLAEAPADLGAHPDPERAEEAATSLHHFPLWAPSSAREHLWLEGATTPSGEWRPGKYPTSLVPEVPAWGGVLRVGTPTAGHLDVDDSGDTIRMVNQLDGDVLHALVWVEGRPHVIRDLPRGGSAPLLPVEAASLDDLGPLRSSLTQTRFDDLVRELVDDTVRDRYVAVLRPPDVLRRLVVGGVRVAPDPEGRGAHVVVGTY